LRDTYYFKLEFDAQRRDKEFGAKILLSEYRLTQLTIEETEYRNVLGQPLSVVHELGAQRLGLNDPFLFDNRVDTRSLLLIGIAKTERAIMTILFKAIGRPIVRKFLKMATCLSDEDLNKRLEEQGL